MNSNIRKAKLEDQTHIKGLLQQLGYPDTDSFLFQKLKYLINSPYTHLYVYEQDDKVIAFISLNFIPQLGVEGDFARISYFAVDHAWQGKGIGTEMERFCVELATKRCCDRIELHCHESRVASQVFYYQLGYEESPKYLVKKL